MVLPYGSHRVYPLAGGMDRFVDLHPATRTISQGEEPLTLIQAKTHLRIEHSGDDEEVTGLIPAARSFCERQANRTIRACVERETTLTDWHRGVFPIAGAPLMAVSSIAYVDDSGNMQTLPPTDYTVSTPEVAPGYLEFTDSFQRPAIADQHNAIQIRFQCGYPTVEQIPPDLKAAIKIQMDILWDHDAQPAVLKRYEETRDAILSNWDHGVYA